MLPSIWKQKQKQKSRNNYFTNIFLLQLYQRNWLFNLFRLKSVNNSKNLEESNGIIKKQVNITLLLYFSKQKQNCSNLYRFIKRRNLKINAIFVDNCWHSNIWICNHCRIDLINYRLHFQIIGKKEKNGRWTIVCTIK